jgi:hypothetical protein
VGAPFRRPSFARRIPCPTTAGLRRPAREPVPAARQRALCVPPRPAAGRSRPSSCPMSPPRHAPSAPRPERSGGLERLHTSFACPSEESAALARWVACAFPPAPCRSDRRRHPHWPSSAGPSAGGGGQRVVDDSAIDDRRRPCMLLAAACGGARAARESRRGSRRSPGGHPLVCAMRVSPVPMSCAHVRRCLIYFMYYCGRNLYVESHMHASAAAAQMCTRSLCYRSCDGCFAADLCLI